MGGFCCSFLGSWPETIINWGAGAYIGMDWSVQTRWNVDWAKGFFRHLTDTAAAQPWTVNDWFQRGTPTAKSYIEEGRTTTVRHAGLPDLALWRRNAYRFLYFDVALAVDYQVTNTRTQRDTIWQSMLWQLHLESVGSTANTTFTVDTVLSPYGGLSDTLHMKIEFDARTPTVVRKVSGSQWGQRTDKRPGWSLLAHDIPVVTTAEGAFAAKLSGPSLAAHVDTLQSRSTDPSGVFLLNVSRYWANDISALQIVLSEVPIIEGKSTKR